MENNNKNYVQVRFESNKANAALNMILHNTRKVKPSYLRDSEAHNKESNTFFIFENDKIEEYNITDKQIQTIVNNKLKQQLQDNINNEKTNNKSFREKKHAIYQDSVITLSNSINTMYANNEIDKKELNKLFLESVKKLEKELNIKAQYISIHFDEKTPHAHITYKNYYNNKSITNTLKKQYSRAQDLVGEVWDKIGFSRGVSKDLTKAKNLTVSQMHKKEKEVELNTLNNKLKKDTLNIVNNSTTTSLIGEKIERKTLLNNIYNTLKKYSNYNFISKNNENIEELKGQLNSNKNIIKNLNYDNSEFKKENLKIKNKNESIKNNFQELEKSATKKINIIINEINNIKENLKMKTLKIEKYEKILKENNININKNKSINNIDI